MKHRGVKKEREGEQNMERGTKKERARDGEADLDMSKIKGWKRQKQIWGRAGYGLLLAPKCPKSTCHGSPYYKLIQQPSVRTEKILTLDAVIIKLSVQLQNPASLCEII